MADIERTVAAGARGLDTGPLERGPLADRPLVKVAENVGPHRVLFACGEALGTAARNAAVPRRPIHKVLHSFVGRVDGFFGEHVLAEAQKDIAVFGVDVGVFLEHHWILFLFDEVGLDVFGFGVGQEFADGVDGNLFTAVDAHDGVCGLGHSLLTSASFVFAARDSASLRFAILFSRQATVCDTCFCSAKLTHRRKAAFEPCCLCCYSCGVCCLCCCQASYSFCFPVKQIFDFIKNQFLLI